MVDLIKLILKTNKKILPIKQNKLPYIHSGNTLQKGLFVNINVLTTLGGKNC